MRPQRQQQMDPRMAMLEQLGINQDPIQQMGGLVQLLNAMEQPDQWQAEMDYRNAGQMMQQDQFDRSAQMQQQGLDQRMSAEEAEAQRWLADMSFKKELAGVEQQRFLQQTKQEQDQIKLRGLFDLIQAAPNLQGMQVPVNPLALQPQLEAAGYGGYFTPPPVTNSRATNPQQALQEQSRQRVLGK